MQRRGAVLAALVDADARREQRPDAGQAAGVGEIGQQVRVGGARRRRRPRWRTAGA